VILQALRKTLHRNSREGVAGADCETADTEFDENTNCAEQATRRFGVHINSDINRYENIMGSYSPWSISPSYNNSGRVFDHVPMRLELSSSRRVKDFAMPAGVNDPGDGRFSKTEPDPAAHVHESVGSFQLSAGRPSGCAKLILFFEREFVLCRERPARSR
jgi:hypothetical protein